MTHSRLCYTVSKCCIWTDFSTVQSTIDAFNVLPSFSVWQWHCPGIFWWIGLSLSLCKVYSVQYTLPSAQCTVYSTQSLGHSVQCTLFRAQCTVHSKQYSGQSAKYNDARLQRWMKILVDIWSSKSSWRQQHWQNIQRCIMEGSQKN